jgi:hypothetical protein
MITLMIFSATILVYVMGIALGLHIGKNIKKDK